MRWSTGIQACRLRDRLTIELALIPASNIGDVILDDRGLPDGEKSMRRKCYKIGRFTRVALSPIEETQDGS